MRRWKLGICSVLVIIFLSIVVPVNGQEGVEKHILVYFNPDVTVEDPIAAVSAMKPFANFVGKKLGVTFEPYFFKKKVDLERFMTENKVTFGIFSQMYIVENYKKLNFEPILIVQKEGQPYYRKVILVRADSGYETLDDLKGKTLSTTALGEDNIPFLNKVVFRDEINVSEHFGKMQIVDSANSAIMAVLYKQADAAAANYLNFVFLKELNPQVDKQLKSIYTSARTPLPGFVYFKDNCPTELRDKASQEMLVMHENPIGQQTMLAFQVEAWSKATLDNWKETAELLGLSLTDQGSVTIEKEASSTSTVTPPAEQKVETISVEEEKKPREFSIQFSDIRAIEVSDNNVLVITGKVTQEEPGVDSGQVSLYYKLSTGETDTIAMKLVKNSMYEGQITLPKSEASGVEKKSTYTIKPGDTLGKIAKKTLGDSKKYMLIAQLNNITDPNVIFAGTELIIMSGEFHGIDVDYQIHAIDMKGKKFSSRKKFFSVIH